MNKGPTQEPAMTDRDKLEALAARCEAAEGPDRELDARIAVATDFQGRDCSPESVRELHTDFGGNNSYAEIGKYWPRLPAYTASLDAAMTLVPEGADWSLEGGWKATVFAPIPSDPGWLTDDPAEAATPALALCAAALRARAAMTDPTLKQQDDQ